MLGVGWTEMLVIGVVALIVIGPKELPALMHRIGKFAGTIRRMGSDFQRELNKTTGLNEITNLRNSVTAPLKATAEAIRKEFNTTTATGQVQPSGAIKPADPKVESVVNEIKAAAGMAPVAAAAAPVMAPLPLTKAAAEAAKAAEAVKAAEPVKAAATAPAKAAVRAARPAKIKAPTESTVATADIPPAKKAAPKSRKPIEAVPTEVVVPAPAKKPAAKKAAKPATAAEIAVAKPAVAPAKAKKPAAKKS